MTRIAGFAVRDGRLADCMPAFIMPDMDKHKSTPNPTPRCKRPSAKEYYHLTQVSNAQGIRDKGLIARDGQMFLFTDMLVADVIARTQVFIYDRYAVFAVHAGGFTGKLEIDNVAEFSRPFQRILWQDRVAPEHLRFVGEFDVVYGRPTAWDYLLGERLGHPREYIEAEKRWQGRLHEIQDPAVVSALMSQMCEELRRILAEARNR